MQQTQLLKLLLDEEQVEFILAELMKSDTEIACQIIRQINDLKREKLFERYCR